MNKKPQPAKYTWEFKQNAVRLVNSTGRSVEEVALELGIRSWRLRNWLKENKDKLDRSSELNELNALQKRVKELEDENSFLKKAAAYFAKTLP